MHRSKWSAYKHDVYEKPNGEEGDYFYLESPEKVMIVPVCEDGRIVLTLQYRYLHGKQSIEFPGGNMPESMRAEEAAQVELLNETGWYAEEFTSLGVFEPAAGCVKRRTHVYIGHVLSEQEQRLADTEEIEVMYRRPDEIAEMIRRGDIWSGSTLAAWALAQNYVMSQTSAEESGGLKTIFDYFLGEE